MTVVIRRLDIRGVRNLKHASLSSLSRVNVFYGDNGAGKTSILESIHLLSSARSFRSHKLKPLINHDEDSCLAFGEINLEERGYQPVGVERHKSDSKTATIRVAGQSLSSSASLAENLPLQVIYSDTFKLLEGGPTNRREFLDWGVFHVEHRFHQAWKSAKRCLKQRNSLLRHGRIDDQQLMVWTSELARLGDEIDGYRKRYLEQLIPIFELTLGKLIKLDGISLSYYRGWDKDQHLSDVFAVQQQREKEQGHTLYGPQRADLKIRYKGSNAADILSRGQQKMLICALRVSQGYLLSQLTGKQSVFLLDDLPSELDTERRQQLCGLLDELGCQVFITCVDAADTLECWPDKQEVSMFHVKHGEIIAQKPMAIAKQ